MIIGIFTIEEINLVAMYLGGTRTDTIMQIAAAVPYMDTEMQSIANSAIRKLITLEESEYTESSFIPADETDG